MQKASVMIARKKYSNLAKEWDFILSNTNINYLFELCWNFRNHRKENIDKIETAILEWDIETIICRQLCLNKKDDKLRIVYDYNLLADLINRFRQIENLEFTIDADRIDIMNEMRRTAYRQFPWQRGFGSAEKLFRYIYIYGQGEAAEYFESCFDVTIEDFIKYGLISYMQSQKHMRWKPYELKAKFYDKNTYIRCLKLLSLPELELRALAIKQLNETDGVHQLRATYRPSPLRTFPILADENDTFRCALPELILNRVTEGLYFNIVNARQNVLENCNKRFEQYVSLYLSSLYDEVKTVTSEKYGKKGHQIDAPDVLVLINKEIRIVIECKATKLTYAGQYSDDPIKYASMGLKQLVKGVSQIWKFCADSRIERFNTYPISEECVFVLLTIDPWFQLSDEIRQYVYNEASKLCEDLGNDVEEQDKKHVVFCSMQEFSDVMLISDLDVLFKTFISAATEPKNRLLNLPAVRGDLGIENQPKRYPLDLANLISWWDNIRDPLQTDEL